MTLQEVAAQGTLAQLEEALASGPDLESRDEAGQTALHLAAGRGATSLVERLLGAGATLEAGDGLGCTALFRALEHGHEETVLALLRSGASLESRNRLGQTSLHWLVCSSKGSPQTLRALVDLLKTRGAGLDTLDAQGLTPLQHLCLAGRGELARELGYASAVLPSAVPAGSRFLPGAQPWRPRPPRRWLSLSELLVALLVLAFVPSVALLWRWASQPKAQALVAQSGPRDDFLGQARRAMAQGSGAEAQNLARLAVDSLRLKHAPREQQNQALELLFQVARQTGDEKQASSALASLVNENPGDQRYLALTDQERAESACRQGLDQEDRQAQADELLSQAQESARAGQGAEARKQAARALELMGEKGPAQERARAHAVLARVEALQENYPGALAQMTLACQLAPDNPSYRDSREGYEALQPAPRSRYVIWQRPARYTVPVYRPNPVPPLPIKVPNHR